MLMTKDFCLRSKASISDIRAKICTNHFVTFQSVVALIPQAHMLVVTLFDYCQYKGGIVYDMHESHLFTAKSIKAASVFVLNPLVHRHIFRSV